MRASLYVIGGAYLLGIGAALCLTTSPRATAVLGAVALLTACLAEYLDARNL